MTPGYFVFLFRLQLEAEVEKEPAGFHNNTNWNCEDAPQIGGGGKRFFLCFFERAQARERWLNGYTEREKCSWYLFSVWVFHFLSFLFVLFQTPHMSAFLSVTWTITSRHSHKHLMKLTWTRMPMLDLLYSLSVPTTVMKVGHIKKNTDIRGVKIIQILPLLSSAEASLFSVTFICLYCLTPLYFKKWTSSILWA